MRKICSSLICFMLCFTSVTYASDGSLGNILTPEQVAEVQSVHSMTRGQVLKLVGVINGDTNGELHADKPIKREELISILVKLISDGSEKFTPPAKPTFSDVSKEHWAYKTIEQAYALGITKGMGDGSFGLGQYVSYKQAVTFMMNVIEEPVNWETAVKDADKQYMFSDNGKLRPEKVLRDDVFELAIRALTYNREGRSKKPLFVEPQYTDMQALQLAEYVGHHKYWAVRPVNIEGMNDGTSWLYEPTGVALSNSMGYISSVFPKDDYYESNVLNFYEFRDLALSVNEGKNNENGPSMIFKYTARIATNVDDIFLETHEMTIKQGKIIDKVTCNGEEWTYEYNRNGGSSLVARATKDGKWVVLRSDRKEETVPAPEWYPYRRTDLVIILEMTDDGSKLKQATVALPNPDHNNQVYELELVK